jgi:DNA-binding MarR family transcriptional regulator
MIEAPPMTDPAFDLRAFLPYRLATVSAQVSRAFAARYRAEFGISVAEWRVLAHLSQAEAVSVRDIHLRVDMEKSKVSRAASRLEAAGFVTKLANDSDRRLVALSLTDAGRALMARLVPVALEFQADLARRLGAAAPGFGAGLTALEEMGR